MSILVVVIPLLPLAGWVLWVEIEDEVGDYAREMSF